MRRLTDVLEPRLATAVLADLRPIRTNLHPELLTRAIATGRPAVVIAFVTRAATAPLGLQRALPVADEAFFAGGHVAAKALHLTLSFDDATSYAIRAVLQHSMSAILFAMGVVTTANAQPATFLADLTASRRRGQTRANRAR